jgi:cytoskeletal protein CcmA (bactofilin family)
MAEKRDRFTYEDLKREPGNLIEARDWNTAMWAIEEVGTRLTTLGDAVPRKNGANTLTGPLTIEDALTVGNHVVIRSVGTDSPAATLEVAGEVKVGTDATINGTLSVSNATITQDATITGKATISGTLTVTEQVRIQKNAIPEGTNDCQLEIFSPNTGRVQDYVKIRFHQASQYYAWLGYHGLSANTAGEFVFFDLNAKKEAKVRAGALTCTADADVQGKLEVAGTLQVRSHLTVEGNADVTDIVTAQDVYLDGTSVAQVLKELAAREEKPLTVAHGKTGDQIVFAYNESLTNPAGYGHVLKTRHYGGGKNGNAIDFYLWQPTDTPQGTGTLHTMTLEGGNVGIGTGTTPPGGKLEVAVTAADDARIPALVVKQDATAYLTIAHDGALTVTGESSFKKKVSIEGDLHLTAGQELVFADNGQIRSLDNNHRILFRRTENKLELREYGQIIFSPGSGGAETAKVVMLANGNVGIGAAEPGGKLEVAVGANDDTTKPLVVGKGTANYLTMLNDGKVGIGAPATDPQVGLDIGANLDIGGKADTAGQVSLQLRSGNTAAKYESNQITFGYANTAQYRHAIKTRHHSGQRSGNAIDFYVWKYLSANNKDEAGTIGTLHTMTLDGGNVGIGTTTPQMPLHIRQPGNNQGIRLDEADTDGKPTDRYLQIYYEGQGHVVFYNQDLKGQWLDTGGGWNKNSDISLKDEIVNLHNSLDNIMQLRPVSFVWKDSQKRDIGFIAQDVEKIFPYLVSSVNIQERDIKGLSYTSFAVLAIAALQEIVRSYDARLTHIEERLASYQRP